MLRDHRADDFVIDNERHAEPDFGGRADDLAFALLDAFRMFVRRDEQRPPRPNHLACQAFGRAGMRDFFDLQIAVIKIIGIKRKRDGVGLSIIQGDVKIGDINNAP